MSKCIVTVGVSGWYPRGVQRLKDSLQLPHITWDGDFIGHTELPEGWPSHQENMYAFKVYAIEAALEKYDQVLWLDASFWAIKNPQPIFDIIEKDGYFLWDSGWETGQWTNDRTLRYFGLTRNEAMCMPMLSSGIMGLNKDSDMMAMDFLSDMGKAMKEGVFNGPRERMLCDKEDERFTGHRNDQSCASIIAYKLGMKLQYNDLVNYDRGDTRDTVCLVCRGM